MFYDALSRYIILVAMAATIRHNAMLFLEGSLMWFNNVQIYQFTQAFTLSAEELGEKLQAARFKPCGSLQPASYGWTTPLGKHGEELIHVANGNIMICARKEEKILPASVVREFVNEKVAEIEATQARKLAKKEKEMIKDEVLLDLLPRAFIRSHLTFAYISPADNFMLINASSSNKAEELLVYLRKTIASLPVTPVALKTPASTTMTRWVLGEEVPADIIINDECELHDTVEGGGIIRCKRQDLESAEIQTHISAGKQVVKLAVTWQENLSCVLNQNLSINRLKFSDEVLAQADSEGSDGYAAQFDEDFTIMALELKCFIPRLIEVFGGEDNVIKDKTLNIKNVKEPAPVD